MGEKGQNSFAVGERSAERRRLRRDFRLEVVRERGVSALGFEDVNKDESEYAKYRN